MTNESMKTAVLSFYEPIGDVPSRCRGRDDGGENHSHHLGYEIVHQVESRAKPVPYIHSMFIHLNKTLLGNSEWRFKPANGMRQTRVVLHDIFIHS